MGMDGDGDGDRGGMARKVLECVEDVLGMGGGGEMDWPRLGWVDFQHGDLERGGVGWVLVGLGTMGWVAVFWVKWGALTTVLPEVAFSPRPVSSLHIVHCTLQTTLHTAHLPSCSMITVLDALARAFRAIHGTLRILSTCGLGWLWLACLLQQPMAVVRGVAGRTKRAMAMGEGGGGGEG